MNEERPRPLLKRIEPDEDILDLQVPMSIEISFVTSAKISEAPLLEKVIERAIEDALKRFKREGFKTFVRAGLVKPITQEELLSVLPRKVHMASEKGGILRQICDTPHVSQKNLTQDDDEVTCKRCLKIIEGARNG